MRRRWVRWLLGAAALLLVLILPWRRALQALERPFVAAGTWIAAHTFGVLEPGSASSVRVTQLEQERTAFAVERAAFEETKTQNEDLRARLNFASRSKHVLVSADIVARTVGVESSSFSVNRGSKDGIAVGMPAVVGDGVLAGKVTSVSEQSATIAAVTDHGVATAVSLLNGVRTIGVATGRDGTLMTLNYIPKEESVNVNDLVVTSGLENAVPSGLLVGVVNAVESKETEPFKQAVIEPLVDVRRVASVSIIVGHAP